MRGVERARGSAASAVGLALIAWLAAAPALARPCEPWPGEPDPLPGVRDPDPVRAQWAELRALELVRAAHAYDRRDPAETQRLLRRALCFDSAYEAAHRGLARLSLVRVHRPEVMRGTAVGGEGAEAWATLDRAIVLPAAARARIERSPDAVARARADTRLVDLATQVRGARFAEALDTAAQARRDVQRLPAAERPARTVRLEVLTATAQLALGHEADARASFERALEADSDLSLDPAQTPPKVLRALESARIARESGR